ncbi:MAG: hypothetical protein N3G21_02155 [Candidatus Hydrogenedentes bacterium]|nr:hypothetical protein [Candidatus Hydrogenedentota bacterium]
MKKYMNSINNAIVVLILFTQLCFNGWTGSEGITITGANSLKEIMEGKLLVTIILKGTNAKDVNLRLIEIHDDYLVFESEVEDRVTYTRDQVDQIIVQSEKQKKPPVNIFPGVTLRTEDRVTVERAWAKLEEIFKSSDANQDLKVECAALLVCRGSQDAENYLQQLLDSNDVPTQFASATALYLAGRLIPPALLRTGLEHGNRAVRIRASILSGLVDYKDGIPSLMSMLQDRSGDISGPSARALAMLGVKEIIPKLFEFLSSPNEEKAESAVYALVALGGDNVKEELKHLLPRLETMATFRAAKVLLYLKDREGRAILSRLFEDKPTLRPEIALLLAREQDWVCQQYLRERLNRRENPTDVNLIYRGRAITALYEGGDPTVLPRYQELLREGSSTVKREVCKLIFRLGDKNLLKILPSTIESREPEVAFEACRAAIGVTLPDYIVRYKKLKGEV